MGGGSGQLHLAPPCRPQAAAHSQLRACRPRGSEIEGLGVAWGVSVGPRNVHCVPQFCSWRKHEHWTGQACLHRPSALEAHVSTRSPGPGLNQPLLPWTRACGQRTPDVGPGLGAGRGCRTGPVQFWLPSLHSSFRPKGPVWLLEASPTPIWVRRSQHPTGTPAQEAAPAGQGRHSGPAGQACADRRGGCGPDRAQVGGLSCLSRCSGGRRLGVPGGGVGDYRRSGPTPCGQAPTGTGARRAH